MTTRLRIVLLGVPVGAVVLFAVVVLASREPRYQGKTLTEWVQQYAAGTDSHNDAQADAAAEAIRHIGPKAVRIFLDDIQAQDPPWKTQMAIWAADQFSLRLEPTLAVYRVDWALRGFSALGRSAQSATAQLGQLVITGDPQVARNAISALFVVGDERAVPYLVAALTNVDVEVRRGAISVLGSMRYEARAAVPALTNTLAEGDSLLRAMAARALGDIAVDAEVVVPALDAAVRDSDLRIRFSAARSLGAFGEVAKDSLPAMRAHYETLPENRRRFGALPLVRVQCEMRDGAIIRGPKDQKRIALVFTAHEFAEGAETILSELEKHSAKASFFLTGAFVDNPKFKPLIQRIAEAKHYVGPHSDRHVLYCDWTRPDKTLISQLEFQRDLEANVRKLSGNDNPEQIPARYFLPPFEHYNRQVADWTRYAGWELINFTPGTRSAADYTGETDKNFVSSQAIFDSILKREQEDPHGLNGFILLLHLGAGPRRADKFHTRFGELLDCLSARGYEFVRVDELLGNPSTPYNRYGPPVRR